MNPDRGDNRVIVRRCETYDRERMEQIVRQGMEELGVVPAGKVFVKPNVVFAGNPETFGTHAYTHPAFMGSALRALSEGDGVHRIDLGENSAMGFPTRHCYKHAGYYDEVKQVQRSARCPVDIFCIDEDLRDTVPVGGEVHETLRLSRTMARADSVVYLPKLKCHCVSKMTGAVKLNIGICCDDDRSIHHDYRLNDKIVDLLAVGWPDLIIMDAVEVGVGNEAFPAPRTLGLVLVGTNPLAVDLVGTRLLGLDPGDVGYLVRAFERGYGPRTLDDVRLLGDLTRVEQLDELARRTGPHDEAFSAWQDIDRELKRLKSPIRFYLGPHRHGDGERCETGCAMGVKMFLASFERFAGAEAFARGKKVIFVVGQVDEEIDARDHDVFFIGKCAAARLRDPRKVKRIKKCFTTANDMTMSIGGKLGIPAPTGDFKMLGGLVRDMTSSTLSKVFSRRALQDLGNLTRRKR